MKDYLKIILILCAGIVLSASPYLPANPTTQAMLASLARKKAVAGYTLQETFSSDSGNSISQDGATRVWIATRITPTATHTVTRIEFWFVKTGSPGGTITAKIWTDASDDPGTLLATSTSSVTATSIGTSAEWVAFDFAGQSLTGSTNYFLGFTNATAGDDSNKITWALGAFNTASWETDQSSNGTTWGVGSSGRGGYCRTYVTP